MSETLAIKYRPRTWGDVTEQASIKTILKNQLERGEVKNAYLFCGGAGTGKTTCARIFANEINHGEGNPIEMDAASNSSVDDVRNIIQQSQHKSLDSKYKVFIIDECHSISNTGWQAFLKLLEEPPTTSISIFCTTDPQKIPKTILSRVQRYEFQRISQNGIFDRLMKILQMEDIPQLQGNSLVDAVEYIAKIADGGMRDAITMLDQCLSYSTEITEETVMKALGLESIDQMQELVTALMQCDFIAAVNVIERVHSSGHDLKQFIKSFLAFLINIGKRKCGCADDYIDLPMTDALIAWILTLDTDFIQRIISFILQLNYDIKWETNPKMLIEAKFMEICYDWTEKIG